MDLATYMYLQFLSPSWNHHNFQPGHILQAWFRYLAGIQNLSSLNQGCQTSILQCKSVPYAIAMRSKIEAEIKP